jgi:hypothetical protein
MDATPVLHVGPDRAGPAGRAGPLDGTYLSVLINPAIRGARRRAAILAAAEEFADGAVADGAQVELDPTEAHLLRVVE